MAYKISPYQRIPVKKLKAGFLLSNRRYPKISKHTDLLFGLLGLYVVIYENKTGKILEIEFYDPILYNNNEFELSLNTPLHVIQLDHMIRQFNGKSIHDYYIPSKSI